MTTHMMPCFCIILSILLFTTGNVTHKERPKTTAKPKSDLDKFCVGKSPGNYEDPKRCDGYISCTNASLAYRMDCPANLWYNVDSDLCDHAGTEGCKGKDSFCTRYSVFRRLQKACYFKCTVYDS